VCWLGMIPTFVAEMGENLMNEIDDSQTGLEDRTAEILSAVDGLENDQWSSASSSPGELENHSSPIDMQTLAGSTCNFTVKILLVGLMMCLYYHLSRSLKCRSFFVKTKSKVSRLYMSGATLTFDLLTSSQRLPSDCHTLCMSIPILMLTAQRVFLFEREQTDRQTDTHTHEVTDTISTIPYSRLGYSNLHCVPIEVRRKFNLILIQHNPVVDDTTRNQGRLHDLVWMSLGGGIWETQWSPGASPDCCPGDEVPRSW